MYIVMYTNVVDVRLHNRLTSLSHLLAYKYREQTEWQWPLFGVHSIMMEKLAQAGKSIAGH
jgi:hypothetical protein